MLIAIIDSGIRGGDIPPFMLVDDIVIRHDGTVNQRISEDFISNHGTLCAQIINAYIRGNNSLPEIYSIDIFNEGMQANSLQLSIALKLCFEKKIPLIHMSIGTISISDFGIIRYWIAKLISNGQIIVAAKSNSGYYTAPANLSGVFGIVASKLMTNDEYQILQSGLIAASSKHQIFNEQELPICNSFAAPVITSKLYTILAQERPFNLSIAELYFQLSKKKYFYSPIDPYFAIDIVILNLDGSNIDISNMVYNCIAVCKSVEEIQTQGLASYSVVIIPRSDGKQSHNAITSLHLGLPKHAGIIFCGKLPSSYDYIKSERLIWSENVFDILDEQRLGPQKYYNTVTRPIVYILDKNSTPDFLFIRQICNLLREHYVEVLPMSNYSRSYLYGFYFFQDFDEVTSTAHQCLQTYSADILICYCKANMTFSSKDDLVIIADYNKQTPSKIVKEIIEFYS